MITKIINCDLRITVKHLISPGKELVLEEKASDLSRRKYTVCVSYTDSCSLLLVLLDFVKFPFFGHQLLWVCFQD